MKLQEGKGSGRGEGGKGKEGQEESATWFLLLFLSAPYFRYAVMFVRMR